MCKLEDQCSIIAVFPLALMMMIMMKNSVWVWTGRRCSGDNETPKKEHITISIIQFNKIK